MPTSPSANTYLYTIMVDRVNVATPWNGIKRNGSVQIRPRPGDGGESMGGTRESDTMTRLSRVFSRRERTDLTSGTEHRRRVSWPVFAILVALLAVSCVGHVWALHRDLPLHDPDESAFVGPAVHKIGRAHV